MIVIKIDGNDQSLFQWDKGQRLIVYGADNSYSAELAFAGDEKSVYADLVEENGEMYCAIPDSLLMRCGRLYCYIRKIDGVYEETIRYGRFDVTPKPKPGDYVEPDEILVWRDLEERIKAIEEMDLSGYATEEYVDNAVSGINLPSGFVAQPEAPDDKSVLWIDTDEVIGRTTNDYATKKYVDERYDALLEKIQEMIIFEKYTENGGEIG